MGTVKMVFTSGHEAEWVALDRDYEKRCGKNRTLTSENL